MNISTVDQKIIDILTAMCWEFEVRKGVDHLDISTPLRTIGVSFWTLFLIEITPSVSDIFQGIFFWVAVLHYGILFLSLVISFFLILVTIFFRDVAKKIMEKNYPKRCPNPLRLMTKKRISWVLKTITFFVLYLIFESLGFLYLAFHSFFILLYLYFLSCDSLPPEKRKKIENRLKEKELAVHPQGA